MLLQWSLDVRRPSGVKGAGPGHVPAEGRASLLRHGVLHLSEHRALKLLLEVVAHEDVQHRVEEAVGCSQRSPHFESRVQNIMVVVMGVQLEQHKHVIWQPADKERRHERRHDLERFGGFGHPVGAQFEDDDGVADDDDGEGDEKSGEETAHCDSFLAVIVPGVVVVADGSTHVSANFTKDQRGETQTDGEDPAEEDNDGRFLCSAMVLRPNRKHHGYAAVDADDHQQEDAAEHVEEHHRGDELTQEASKDPVLHHHVNDVEWEEGAEDEVGDGEAQVPRGVHRLLHLEAGDPDDHSVS